MTEPAISLGNPREAAPSAPIVHAWIELKRGGLSLVMEAEGDASDQRVIDINFSDGGAEIVARNLFTPRLCAAFGIANGDAPSIRAEEGK